MSSSGAHVVPWEDRARETFWVCLNIGAAFVLAEDFLGLESLSEGFWQILRSIMVIMWIAAGLAWALASIRKRRAEF